MQLPWKKRNRRQARNDEPSLLERVNWRVVGVAAGVIGGCVAVALLLALALDRPLRRVLVEGTFQRVSPPEIEAAVVAVARGGLASVDLEEVQARVEGIDWVDHAIVQRRLPDTLRVLVVEQVAAARWNDTGLLNARGELFLAEHRDRDRHVLQALFEAPRSNDDVVSSVFGCSLGQHRLGNENGGERGRGERGKPQPCGVHGKPPLFSSGKSAPHPGPLQAPRAHFETPCGAFSTEREKGGTTWSPRPVP